MPIDHNAFVEDIMTLLADIDEDSQSSADVMDSIVRIIDDYKSELLLEENENSHANVVATLDEEEVEESLEEKERRASIPRNSTMNVAQSKRAFMMEKAKKQYYRENGISLEDEENFTILEKNEHRQKINEIVYRLMLEDSSGDNESVSSTPFVRGGVIRRASQDDDEEDDEYNSGVAEAKWKRQQKRKLNRKIAEIKGEIEALEAQNKVPRVSQAVLNRNDERIEELEEELEDLENTKAQY